MVSAESGHRGACTWIGAEPEGGPGPTDVRLVYRPLPGGLYDGTSGVAMFLASLHAATAEPMFRDCALGAMRHAIARASGEPIDGWFGAYALTRLRAYELLAEPRYLADAEIALETTSRFVEGSLDSGSWNFSLCHGLAGNADVLLQASRAMPSEFGHHAEMAIRIAQYGRERYGPAGQWPSGAAGGKTCNLFLGDAGVGFFYLRLADPELATPLLLGRSAPSWCQTIGLAGGESSRTRARAA